MSNQTLQNQPQQQQQRTSSEVIQERRQEIFDGTTDTEQQKLSSLEKASLDDLEGGLFDIYGEHWAHCKWRELKLKDVYYGIGKDAVIAKGWDGVRAVKRKKIINDIAADAAKRKARLAQHDMIMQWADIPGRPDAYREYKEEYARVISAAKTLNDAQAARKAAEKKLSPENKTAIGLEVERERLQQKKEHYMLKHGLDESVFQGKTTLKALKEAKKQGLKAQKEKPTDILAAEEQEAEENYGEDLFAAARLKATGRHEKICTAGQNAPDSKQYKEARGKLKKAKDVAQGYKVLDDDYDRWKDSEGYLDAYETAGGRGKDLPHSELKVSKVGLYYHRIVEHMEGKEKWHRAGKDAAIKAQADRRKAQDGELKDIIESIDTRKSKKGDPEERHKKMDAAEDRLVTQFENEIIPYDRVGRKDKDDKAYAVKAREKLIMERLKLCKKARERAMLSETFEAEMKSEANKGLTPEERVRLATSKGVEQSKKDIDSAKTARVNAHRHRFLDDLEAKYVKKYTHVFFTAAKLEVQTEKGKDGPAFQEAMKEPRFRHDVLKEAAKKAAVLQHQSRMKGTSDEEKAYQKAYNGASFTKSDGQKRSIARDAMRHAQNMKDDNYKQMFNTFNAQKTTRTATAQRKARKHMKRMQDNPAYRQAVGTLAPDASGETVLAARKKGRRAAQLEQETQYDKAHRERYGDELFDLAMDGYDDKYSEKNAKTVRKHAHKRMRQVHKLQQREDMRHYDGQGAGDVQRRYKEVYEDAIKNGSTPSEANKIAQKEQEKMKKSMQLEIQFQLKAEEKAKELPEVDRFYAFYKKKYPSDLKKAYKHAVDAAQALRLARSEADEQRALYSHPRFQDYFAEEYEKSGDKEAALEKAREKCLEEIRSDAKRAGKGKQVVGDTKGITPRAKRFLDAWADSELLKTVRHIKKIEEAHQANPQDEEGFIGKLANKITKWWGQDKSTVDKPEEKEGPSGFSQLVGVGTGYVMPVVMPGVSVATSGMAIDTATVTDPTKAISQGFQLTKLTGFLSPALSAVKLGAALISYIKDKVAGKTTAESTVQLLMKIEETLPSVLGATRGALKMSGVQTQQMFGAVNMLGNFQTIMSNLVGILGNGLKLHKAREGAEAMSKQKGKSTEALKSRENRNIFTMKKRLGRSTKTEIDPTMMRNRLDTGTDTGDTRKKLEQWQVDDEFAMLYAKLIRERSLDLGQNIVGVIQGGVGFIPEFGQIGAAVIGALNSLASFTRAGIRTAKKLGRDQSAAHPMRHGSSIFNWDRSTHQKALDRARYAMFIYNQIVELPVPEDMTGLAEKDRGAWVIDAYQRYDRVSAYTEMAMDLRELNTQDRKKGILETLAKHMAASTG